MEEDKLMKELEEAKATFESESQVQEHKSENETPSEEVSQDPYLDEALKNGYNPNYNGADKKSPEQYVRDGSFFKKISHQKKEIGELKDAVKDLIQQQQKAERFGYEKALKELVSQKHAAIEVGDIERVNQIDTELDAVKEELRKPVETPQVMKEPEVHPAAADFKERNMTWFGRYDQSKTLSEEEKENLEMTETALVYDDYLGRMIAEGKAEYSPEQAVQMVQDRIKKYYPHRFENPKKDEPMAVGRPSGVGSGSSNVSASLVHKLTDRQKQQHELYSSIDPKFGSLEEYAKFLDKIGDLKQK